MSISLLKNGNCQALLNYLIKGEFDFELSCSNYTTGIRSDIINMKFVSKKHNPKTFSAFAKLKADLKNLPIPNITTESVRYFEHDFRKNCYYPEVINIDLKSAYSRILYIDKLISDDTFSYFNGLEKQERLAAVGMLAGRKRIFVFEKGKPISHKEEVNPMSGFFFYCVKRTQEIMAELKKICEQNYLFTWVDGIYFLPDKKIVKKCEDYLNEIKFLYRIDNLQDFRIIMSNEKPFLTFIKNGELKKFNLPAIQTAFKRIIIDSIIEIKKQENEKSKIKNPY